MASATTEVGTGGDLRSSICAAEVVGGAFTLTKQAPVISYGQVCRRHSGNLSPRSGCAGQRTIARAREARRILGPAALDMGTRSASAAREWLRLHTHRARLGDQILPTPFDVILSQTMHPYSHIVWGALWTGIAARRSQSGPGLRPRRIAQNTRRNAHFGSRLAESRPAAARDAAQRLRVGSRIPSPARSRSPDAFSGFGFAIRTNNLMLSCSHAHCRHRQSGSRDLWDLRLPERQQIQSDRQLRDAHGCALMVNNDRITKLNATMLLAHRETF